MEFIMQQKPKELMQELRINGFLWLADKIESHFLTYTEEGGMDSLNNEAWRLEQCASVISSVFISPVEYHRKAVENMARGVCDWCGDGRYLRRYHEEG